VELLYVYPPSALRGKVTNRCSGGSPVDTSQIVCGSFPESGAPGAAYGYDFLVARD
jgi:hypothetical protein